MNQHKDNKHSTETLKFIRVFTIRNGIPHMTASCSVAATHTSWSQSWTCARN